MFGYYRTKLDCNREVGEAAQGNPIAVAAYDTYHGYIEQAKQTIGRGILFDIHGQVSSSKFKLTFCTSH